MKPSTKALSFLFVTKILTTIPAYPLEELPKDIIGHIANYMSPKDLASLNLTSKRIHKALIESYGADQPSPIEAQRLRILREEIEERFEIIIKSSLEEEEETYNRKSITYNPMHISRVFNIEMNKDAHDPLFSYLRNPDYQPFGLLADSNSTIFQDLCNNAFNKLISNLTPEERSSISEIIITNSIEIPSSLCSLPNLTDITIHEHRNGTNLSTLGNLNNVRTLRLRIKNNTVIPEELGNMKNLTELNIDASELTRKRLFCPMEEASPPTPNNILPETIRNLSNLRTLRLSNTTTVPRLLIERILQIQNSEPLSIKITHIKQGFNQDKAQNLLTNNPRIIRAKFDDRHHNLSFTLQPYQHLEEDRTE